MQSRLSDAGAAHNGANVIHRESASGPFFAARRLSTFYVCVFCFVTFVLLCEVFFFSSASLRGSLLF
jgi:hypothetical protein